MTRTTNLPTHVPARAARSTRAALRALMSCVLVASALGACAHKDLLTMSPAQARRVALQLTTTASAQQLLAPSWVFVAAAYGSSDGFQLLSYKFVALSQGSQQIELSVDLAPCYSYRASQGQDGCPLYVAAALVPDTLALRDSTRSIFGEAYDSAVPLGPFDVGSGKAPTIPPIDLSLTRLGTVAWQSDEALRLGGGDVPNLLVGGVLGELAPITGVVNGGSVSLIAVAQAFDATNADPSQRARLRPQLNIFENGQWRHVMATAFPDVVPTGVSAIAANDIYVSTTTGLLHYDGATFTRVVGVTTGVLSVASVRVGGTNSIVAGSGGGRVWVGRGDVFQQYTVPIGTAVNLVCITGPNEAFASANNGSANGLYRFDGTTWTSVPTPQPTPKIDLVCPSPGVAYALNSGTQPPYRWNGTTWVQLPTAGLPPQRQWHIDASTTELWAYGDSAGVDRVYAKYDGSAWITLVRSRIAIGASRPWASPSGGEAYVFTFNGGIKRMTSAGVTTLAYQPSLRDVRVNSASSAVVVGDHGFLSRLAGNQWIVDAPPAGTFGDRALQGVWSDGPSNAWAVGAQSAIYRFTGAAWTLVSDSLRAVAARDNYNRVWGVASDVWAVGDNSIVHCTSSTSCSNEAAPGTGALLGIWGSSATNVIAVGEGGRIVRYNGSAWSSMTSPTTRTIARISGSSASDVWAVGDSVLLHYDGTQWATVPMVNELADVQHAVPATADRLNGQPIGLAVYARGPREVYLAEQFGSIKRYDGYGWVEVSRGNPRHAYTALHGTSANGGCVLAVTEGVFMINAPTLFRGIGPTGCFASGMGAPPAWP